MAKVYWVMSHTPSSKLRKFSEISPDQQEAATKRLCQDESKMNEELMAFMNDIRSDLKNEISILHSKINDINLKLDERMDKIEANVKNVQDEIVHIRADIIPLEEKTNELDLSSQRHDLEINVLNQVAIQNQVILVNVSSSINEQNFQRDMNKWTSDVTKDTIANFKLFKSKGSQTAVIDFATMLSKKKFLEFIKSKQKDQQQKYIPILNEHIFDMAEDDATRANVIEIRTAMTKVNRELFNKAREERKLNKDIEGIWIANGSVNIRIKNVKKPYQLTSIDHLDELLRASTKKRMK